MNQQTPIHAERYSKDEVLKVALDIAASDIEESHQAQSTDSKLLGEVSTIIRTLLSRHPFNNVTAPLIEKDAELAYGRYDHLLATGHKDAYIHKIASDALSGVLECLEDLTPISLSEPIKKSPGIERNPIQISSPTPMKKDGTQEKIFKSATIKTNEAPLLEKTQPVSVDLLVANHRENFVSAPKVEPEPAVPPEKSISLSKAEITKTRVHTRARLSSRQPESRRAQMFTPHQGEAEEPKIPRNLLTMPSTATVNLDPNARYEVYTVIRLGMDKLRGTAPTDLCRRLEQATNRAFADNKEGGNGITVAQILKVRDRLKALTESSGMSQEQLDVHRAVMGIITTGIARLREVKPIPQQQERRIRTYTDHYRPQGLKLPDKPQTETVATRILKEKKFKSHVSLKETPATLSSSLITDTLEANTTIIQKVAQHYEVPEEQMTNGLRLDHTQTHARHIAMYLMRQTTGQSFREIGEAFGGLSGPSVLMACKHLNDDPKSLAEVERMKLSLQLTEAKQASRGL